MRWMGYWNFFDIHIIKLQFDPLLKDHIDIAVLKNLKFHNDDNIASKMSSDRPDNYTLNINYRWLRFRSNWTVDAKIYFKWYREYLLLFNTDWIRLGRWRPLFEIKKFRAHVPQRIAVSMLFDVFFCTVCVNRPIGLFVCLPR